MRQKWIGFKAMSLGSGLNLLGQHRAATSGPGRGQGKRRPIRQRSGGKVQPAELRKGLRSKETRRG